ncbi:MAG: type VI secretion system baseplate subunit TssE [Planctomycetota bacterium]|nr:type VI secretion system baseplate subunit TssE [Planctomycetota bacterium]
MADKQSRERLQPALLDRLTDHAPSKDVESIDERVFSMKRLRVSVQRDLQWLFNTSAMFSAEDADLHPEVATSVLNFGMPNFAGMSASGMQLRELEQHIRDRIRMFEPRLISDSVRVSSVTQEAMTSRAVVFEISAHLWAEPVPLEVVLRTEVDLESGHATVTEAGGDGI